MSIQSEVTALNIRRKSQFPCLRVNIKEGYSGCKGTVVMFTSEDAGIVIYTPDPTIQVGVHSTGWCYYSDVTQWSPCTITLTTET
jgi:hypothetical protein